MELNHLNWGEIDEIQVDSLTLDKTADNITVQQSASPLEKGPDCEKAFLYGRIAKTATYLLRVPVGDGCNNGEPFQKCPTTHTLESPCKKRYLELCFEGIFLQLHGRNLSYFRLRVIFSRVVIIDEANTNG